MSKAYLILVFTIITYIPYSMSCIARGNKRNCSQAEFSEDLTFKLNPYQKCKINASELSGVLENKCTSTISTIPIIYNNTYIYQPSPPIAKCVLRPSSELFPSARHNCTREYNYIQCSDCIKKEHCTDLEDCLRDYKVLLDCVKATEEDLPKKPQPRIRGLMFSKSTIPIVKKTLFQISNNITIFRAANNEIEEIEDDAFSDLRNLTLVDVSYNKLKKISLDLFNCQKIRNFIAGGNKELEMPDNEPFINAPKLEKLNLQDCNIGKLSASNFKHLQGLIRLSLARNNIKVLPVDVFKPLNNLYWLDLSGNKIRTISLTVFAQARPPLMMLVNGNPWECDCALYPVIEYSRSQSHTDDAVCAKPSSKKWKEIMLNCPK